jgi:hypothetical protein
MGVHLLLLWSQEGVLISVAAMITTVVATMLT